MQLNEVQAENLMRLKLSILFAILLCLNLSSSASSWLLYRFKDPTAFSSEETVVVDQILGLFQDELTAIGRTIILESSPGHNAKVDGFGLRKGYPGPGITILLDHPTALEGFAATLCHELGHVLGGSPKTNYFAALMIDSATDVEGQADFFAATRCLPKVASFLEIPADPVHLQAFIVKAAEAMLLNTPKSPKKLKLPSRTLSAHPFYECRLKTFSTQTRPNCWYVEGSTVLERDE